MRIPFQRTTNAPHTFRNYLLFTIKTAEDKMASNNTFGVGNYHILWSQTMSSIVGQLAGKEAGVEVGGPVDDSSPDRLWVTFPICEALLGEQRFCVSRADALHLG